MRLTFSLPYADSLKDKRRVRKSLTDKVARAYNVSVAEVGTQDDRGTLTLGVAAVSGDASYLKGLMEGCLRFMEAEAEAEAELIRVER